MAAARNAFYAQSGGVTAVINASACGVIELDAINPQVAARLARALDRWKKLAEPLRSAAREAIARVAAKPDLSNDVREVVSRALAE